jgi:hypothetical protein
MSAMWNFFAAEADHRVNSDTWGTASRILKLQSQFAMRVAACRTRMKLSQWIENRIDEVHGGEWYIPWERWTRTIGISISWSVFRESLPTTMHMNLQNSRGS